VLGRSIFTLRVTTARGARDLMTWPVAGGARLPSQGIYRVAPGGERLAWLDGRVLRVLDADGRERKLAEHVSMFRFAPDGKQLVFLERGAVVLADPATGARRTLGSIDAQFFIWMEWIRGGVVVAAREKTGEARTITYFPVAVDGAVDGAADAKPRLVARHDFHIHRVTGTPSSTRLVWFTAHGIFGGDALAGEPRLLDGSYNFDRYLLNAELAPDASEAVWTDDFGLHRIDATSGRVATIARAPMQSLWYSADGRELAYADQSNAFVRRGDRVTRMLAHTDWGAGVGTARYRRDAPGLLVIRNGEALAWNPDGGARERLARATGVVDADTFRGGMVLIVARPDPKDPPRIEDRGLPLLPPLAQ